MYVLLLEHSSSFFWVWFWFNILTRQILMCTVTGIVLAIELEKGKTIWCPLAFYLVAQLIRYLTRRNTGNRRLEWGSLVLLIISILTSSSLAVILVIGRVRGGKSILEVKYHVQVPSLILIGIAVGLLVSTGIVWLIAIWPGRASTTRPRHDANHIALTRYPTGHNNNSSQVPLIRPSSPSSSISNHTQGSNGARELTPLVRASSVNSHVSKGVGIVRSVNPARVRATSVDSCTSKDVFVESGTSSQPSVNSSRTSTSINAIPTPNTSSKLGTKSFCQFKHWHCCHRYWE